MASACDLEWVPDSLYNTSLSTIVTFYSRYKKELKTLTDSVQFDIYYKVGMSTDLQSNQNVTHWIPGQLGP